MNRAFGPRPAGRGPTLAQTVDVDPAEQTTVLARRSAVVQLSLAEGRRVLLHPVVLGAVALLAAPWLIEAVTAPAATSYRVLTQESQWIQIPMLLLAAATYLAANLAGLRPFRSGTVGTEGTASMPRWHRSAAQVMGLLGVAAVSSILTVGRLAQLAAQQGAAGRVMPAELLTVPALVLFCGVLGLVVAQLGRTLMVSALILALLTIVVLLLVFAMSDLGWLSLVAYDDPFSPGPTPSELVGRPAGWHVFYLLSASGLLAVVLFWSGGLPRPAGVTGGVLCAALLITTAGAQLAPVSEELVAARQQARTAPAAQQICEIRGSITYCAFPEFDSRIDAWDQVARGALAAVPPSATPHALTIRQRLQVPSTGGRFGPPPLAEWSADDLAAGTPDTVPVSTRWATGGNRVSDQRAVLDLALVLADRLVTGQGLAPEVAPRCGAQGAIVLWVALAADPAVGAALDTVNQASSSSATVSASVLDSSAGYFIGERETTLGTALAARPEARDLVHAHWDQLTDPATSVDEAAELLGLPSPDPITADWAWCR